MLVIKTSDNIWFEEAIKAFTEKKEFKFIDDAEFNFTEKDLKSALHLIKATKKKKIFSWKTIVKVLTSLGISAIGVWIIILAIADPDPTSKLGLLIGGGLVIIMTGSYGALRSLGIKFRIKAKVGQNEFTIEPDK